MHYIFCLNKTFKSKWDKNIYIPPVCNVNFLPSFFQGICHSLKVRAAINKPDWGECKSACFKREETRKKESNYRKRYIEGGGSGRERYMIYSELINLGSNIYSKGLLTFINILSRQSKKQSLHWREQKKQPESN